MEKELNINSDILIPTEITDELNNNNNNNNNDSDDIIIGDRLLTLYRINLFASSGSLISIVGQVGSGKSSIIMALLGNMKLCFGDVAG